MVTTTSKPKKKPTASRKPLLQEYNQVDYKGRSHPNTTERVIIEPSTSTDTSNRAVSPNTWWLSSHVLNNLNMTPTEVDWIEYNQCNYFSPNTSMRLLSDRQPRSRQLLLECQQYRLEYIKVTATEYHWYILPSSARIRWVIICYPNIFDAAL